MKSRLLSITTAVGLVASMFVVGFQQEVSASQHAAASAELARPTATNSKITKVVFVGKKNACDCTRKRVEAGWTALQEALGDPAKLPVERLQIDTEESKVEPYRKQRPIMVLPALYFVDDEAKVIELLQGEVTAEQIREAIKK